jgi:hypothetical protein
MDSTTSTSKTCEKNPLPVTNPKGPEPEFVFELDDIYYLSITF